MAISARSSRSEGCAEIDAVQNGVKEMVVKMVSTRREGGQQRVEHLAMPFNLYSDADDAVVISIMISIYF